MSSHAIEREELDILLRKLIGTRLAVKVNSDYIACIINFELYDVTFSGGGHRSNVSDVMIEDNNVSFHDKDSNVCFAFEYKDVESVVKDKKEKCELHLIYRDGTNIRIYKESNFLKWW